MLVPSGLRTRIRATECLRQLKTDIHETPGEPADQRRVQSVSISATCLNDERANAEYSAATRRGASPRRTSRSIAPAEHIVRARGKRTKYTSVSLDPDKIDDFGPTLLPGTLLGHPEQRPRNH